MVSISDKIKKSKEGIKYSHKLNVSATLYEYISILESRADDSEFLKTIPVQIVASNESFFKETIASLIDFSDEFLDNSKTILKKNNFKIDVSDVLLITKEHFTIGDLISYSYKYSSFESIFKTFVEVSGIDIFKRHENSEELSGYNEVFNEIIEIHPVNRNRIFKNMNEVYDIRNIICHDFLAASHKLELDSIKLKQYIIDCYIFQELISLYLSIDIYSKNNPSKKELEVRRKELELEALYEKLSNKFDNAEQHKRLNTNKEFFNKFLEKDSKDFARSFYNFKDDDFTFEILEWEHKLKLLDQRIRIIKEDINYSS